MNRSLIRLATIALTLCSLCAQSAQEPPKTDDRLFPSDRLLDVQITVEKRDWRRLCRQSRTFQSALSADRKRGEFEKPYSYFDADVAIDGVVFKKVGLRKKGFLGSLSTSRPSLKVKLNHSDPAGEIAGLTNLTFNNNQQDESLTSQFLGYRLFNAAGSPAPRAGYARITVNGKYLGIYSHVEAYRAPLLEREFGSADGVLYEGTVVDFFPGWAKSFEHKRGDADLGQKQIQRLIDILAEDHDDVEAAIAEVVDLDAFYTFWALEGLLGFWDGYTSNKNNFFFYIHPETQRMHFLPWGGDVMFAKFNPMERYRDEPLSVKSRSMLAHRLYQLESGRRRYRETLERLLTEHWNEEAMLAEFDRLEELLDPHLGRSQRRAIDKMYDMREFIEERRAEVLAEIQDGMPEWTRSPNAPWIMPSDNAWEDSIWRATRDGDIEGLKRHIEAGADVNATRDDDGSHPLTLAAVAGQREAARFLLDRGAEPNGASNDGDTALHAAAFFGRIEILEVLIDAGADINTKARDGDTPLDHATMEWTTSVERFVGFIGRSLQLEFDYPQIKQDRPKAAAWLKERGAESGK